MSVLVAVSKVKPLLGQFFLVVQIAAIILLAKVLAL
jgi:hypothetical protein